MAKIERIAQIYWIRHGQRPSTPVFSDGSPGTKPVYLTPEGIKQMETLGKLLRDRVLVDRIIASPLPRTRQSAEILHWYLSQRKPIPPIEYDELLLDRKVDSGLNNGVPPRGLSWEEFKKEQIESGYTMVEPFASIINRVRTFVYNISNQYQEALMRIAVVTHQDIVHAAVANSLFGNYEQHELLIKGVSQSSFTLTTHILEGSEKDLKGDVNCFGWTDLPQINANYAACLVGDSLTYGYGRKGGHVYHN